MGEVDEQVRKQGEEFREYQQRALQQVDEQGVMSRKAIIEIGHAAQQIILLAEREQADLLVIGRSGHSQIWGRLLGSTADRIVQHAPCFCPHCALSSSLGRKKEILDPAEMGRQSRDRGNCIPYEQVRWGTSFWYPNAPCAIGPRSSGQFRCYRPVLGNGGECARHR